MNDTARAALTNSHIETEYRARTPGSAKLYKRSPQGDPGRADA